MCDDREGTEQEFRLAIGNAENIVSNPLHSFTGDDESQNKDQNIMTDKDAQLVPAMLILDVKLSQLSTLVSLCIQRPQLLVALDFLLAVAEFFVPTVGHVLSNEEDTKSFEIIDALILDESTYKQPSAEVSLSPSRPLIVDDERYEHFVYDGCGGTLYLKDRQGFNITAPSPEAIIYVGSGKKLQFKNIVIKVLYLTHLFSVYCFHLFKSLYQIFVSFFKFFWCRTDCIWIHVFLSEAIVATQLQRMIMSTWRVIVTILQITLQINVLIMNHPRVFRLIDHKSL